MAGRDWDKELAKIDKLMAKQGVNPDADPDSSTNAPTLAPKKKVVKASVAVRKPEANAPKPPKQSSASVVAAPAAASGLVATPLRVWLIAALGPIGAGALLFWPYASGCGAGLGFYLVGVAGVLVTALWALQTGWRYRRGAILVVGLVTLLAALALIANVILPRVGYAADVLNWTCST